MPARPRSAADGAASAATTPTQPTKPAQPTHRRLALAVLVTCQLMLILDTTVMNVALPRIQNGLHFSSTGLAWVINAYTLTVAGLLLLGGRAGDILGRRRTFVGGIALFTAASFAGGFATDPAWLLTARIVQGVGAAAAGPSTLALITTTFTEQRERIKALALFSAVASGGFAIGLIVGGLLTEWASWRWVLFINVPIGIAVVLLTPRVVADPPRRQARLDIPGAATGTAGMAGLVYGFIRAAGYGWSDRQTVVALTAGAVFLAAFITIETRTRQPLMPLRLFGDRNRAGAYANMFLAPAGMFGIFYFLTQFLQNLRGFSPLATGFAFLPMGVGLFAITRVLPRLIPRFGPKRLAITGSLLILAGLAWLTRLTPDSGYATHILVPLLLVGLGAGLGISPLNVVIMSSVDPEDIGAAGGVLQTMQQSGASLGLAVLVTVFGTVERHGRPGTAGIVHAMTDSFTVSAGIAALALLIALSFRRAQ